MGQVVIAKFEVYKLYKQRHYLIRMGGSDEFSPKERSTSNLYVATHCLESIALRSDKHCFFQFCCQSLTLNKQKIKRLFFRKSPPSTMRMENLYILIQFCFPLLCSQIIPCLQKFCQNFKATSKFQIRFNDFQFICAVNNLVLFYFPLFLKKSFNS